MTRRRVLFVCSGNTCRSLFAEYVARHQYCDRIDAESVGLQPGSVSDTENAVFTLRQYKIDAAGHQPRSIEDVTLDQFDVIVALDEGIARTVGSSVDSSKLVVWDVDDPYGSDLEEYRRCATLIARNVRLLVDSLEGGHET